MVLQGRFAGGRPLLPRQAAASAQARMPAGAEAFPVDLRLGRGDGKPLPADLRNTMEAAFGADFSDVRVRVGPEASSIGALAFTVGSRIYFAQGQYNPDTLLGRMLIGHELAHVLQQRAGRVPNPFGRGLAVVKDPALENEAERMGVRAAMIVQPAGPVPAAIRPPVAGTMATIQRAMPSSSSRRGGGDKDDDNPYRKFFPKLVTIKKSKRAAARRHKVVTTSDRLSKRQKAVLGEKEDSLPVRPNYVPPKDSLNNAIWDGQRAGLDFSGPVKLAMAATKAGGCQIRIPGTCTGGADSIDHVEDFATVQAGLDRYVICDGHHHWSACYKADAQDCYDAGGNAARLQWACTQCNSSKNGARGRYENQPTWLCRCPGDCDYSFKGEEAS